jgi:cell division initiation protein
VAITPHDIETKQFAIALRGFDQKEVTAFLQSVASDYKEALESTNAGTTTAPVEEEEASQPAPTAQDPYIAMGDEVAAVLRSARDAAAEVRRKADEEAEAILAKARNDATDLEQTARRHLARPRTSCRTRGAATSSSSATSRSSPAGCVRSAPTSSRRSGASRRCRPRPRARTTGALRSRSRA